MNNLTNICKILSDENRLRMTVLLYQEVLCVCELSGILGIPQPRISQNLSKLKDLNLVKDERKEKFVYYSLKRDNKIFIEILQNIIKDIDNYPQLLMDKESLNNKEKYLKQCYSVNG